MINFSGYRIPTKNVIFLSFDFDLHLFLTFQKGYILNYKFFVFCFGLILSKDFDIHIFILYFSLTTHFSIHGVNVYLLINTEELN